MNKVVNLPWNPDPPEEDSLSATWWSLSEVRLQISSKASPNEMAALSCKEKAKSNN